MANKPNSVAFLYTGNEELDFEIKNIYTNKVPQGEMSKRKVKKCAKSTCRELKTLMKEIKQDLNHERAHGLEDRVLSCRFCPISSTDLMRSP